jgi:hypothetical protein
MYGVNAEDVRTNGTLDNMILSSRGRTDTTIIHIEHKLTIQGWGLLNEAYWIRCTAMRK